MPSDLRIVGDTYIFRIVGRRLRLFRPTVIDPDVKVLWLVLSPNAQNGNLTT
jgi:hypothetical protein